MLMNKRKVNFKITWTGNGQNWIDVYLNCLKIWEIQEIKFGQFLKHPVQFQNVLQIDLFYMVFKLRVQS